MERRATHFRLAELTGKMRWRSDIGFSLPLPCLSKANGKHLWDRCFFCTRPGACKRPGERRYTRPSDSGFDITFRFCPNCGSTVLWEPSRKPETIAVAVGAFADPAFPPPSRVVYEEHRRPWVEMPI